VAHTTARISRDYVWGKPAERAIMALLVARADRSRAMNWIQIGAMAGPTILWAALGQLIGNGQGGSTRRGRIDSGAVPQPGRSWDAGWHIEGSFEVGGTAGQLPVLARAAGAVPVQRRGRRQR
jgi:hypothetical protein